MKTNPPLRQSSRNFFRVIVTKYRQFDQVFVATYIACLHHRHLADVSVAGVTVSIAVVVWVATCVFHAVLKSAPIVRLVRVPGSDGGTVQPVKPALLKQIVPSQLELKVLVACNSVRCSEWDFVRSGSDCAEEK